MYIDVSSSLTFFYYLETFSLICFGYPLKNHNTPTCILFWDVLLKANTKFDLNQNGCEVTASDSLFISFIYYFYYTEAAVMTCDMVYIFLTFSFLGLKLSIMEVSKE